MYTNNMLLKKQSYLALLSGVVIFMPYTAMARTTITHTHIYTQTMIDGPGSVSSSSAVTENACFSSGGGSNNGEGGERGHDEFGNYVGAEGQYYARGSPSNYGADFSGGGGNSSGGRVICTYFYEKGELARKLYIADMRYTLTRLYPATVRGYHVWAIPTVLHMRRHPGGLVENIFRVITLSRAEELGYKMGIRARPNYLGKFFRAVMEPVCFLLGLCVKEQDYSVLYKNRPAPFLRLKPIAPTIYSMQSGTPIYVRAG